MIKSPILCEHANEVPNVCRCPGGCYCKSNTCRGYKMGKYILDRNALKKVDDSDDSEMITISRKDLDVIRIVTHKLLCDSEEVYDRISDILDNLDRKNNK